MTRILRACLALAYMLLAAGFAWASFDYGLEWSARLVALAVAGSCLHTAYRSSADLLRRIVRN